jgi:hypothetical protein
MCIRDRVLGLRIRRGLAAAGDPATLERWLGASEALAEFERMVRTNVSLKHASAHLLAQWAERMAPSAPAGAARGR